MTSISVTLSGGGVLPPVEDAMLHCARHPDHTVYLHLHVRPEEAERGINWECMDCNTHTTWMERP